ncbi:hypothetical protein D0860_08304 [Hortaea werneckii]|uniref:Uncharacterized protein n=1 Tax=Hortaea werneckii TaxID=91943 RepID=A0A3M7GFE8_HORWE|nr:hypothetical protein D0860_08304 [Hortaea werneckii]
MLTLSLLSILVLAELTSRALAFFNTTTCTANQTAFARTAFDDAFDDFHTMYLSERTGMGIGELSYEDIPLLRTRYFGHLSPNRSAFVVGSGIFTITDAGSLSIGLCPGFFALRQKSTVVARPRGLRQHDAAEWNTAATTTEPDVAIRYAYSHALCASAIALGAEFGMPRPVRLRGSGLGRARGRGSRKNGIGTGWLG